MYQILNNLKQESKNYKVEFYIFIFGLHIVTFEGQKRERDKRLRDLYLLSPRSIKFKTKYENM